jgi:hypothetical protein
MSKSNRSQEQTQETTPVAPNAELQTAFEAWRTDPERGDSLQGKTDEEAYAAFTLWSENAGYTDGLVLEGRSAFEQWRAQPEQATLLEGTTVEEAYGLWKETLTPANEADAEGGVVEPQAESFKSSTAESNIADKITPVENKAPQAVALGVLDSNTKPATQVAEEPQAPVTTEHNQASRAPVSPQKADSLVEPHLRFVRERLTDNQYGAFLDMPDGLRAQFVIVLQYVDNMDTNKAMFQEEGVRHQESLYRALTKILNLSGPQLRLAVNLLLSIYHANREGVFHPMYANRYMRNLASLRESDARLFLNLQTLFITVAEPKNRQARVKHMDLVRLLSDVGREPTMVTQVAKNSLIAFLKG